MSKSKDNRPCKCGSGKKFIKCCKNKTSAQESVKVPGKVFRLKGKNAEDFVHSLAKKTFIEDWCYLNPMLEPGKELCDLLIIFGNIAIIIQVKDLKLDKNGKYKESEVERNKRQLLGAYRSLFALRKKVTLENPRRGEEEFDPSVTNEIYLISIFTGENEEYFSFVEEIDGKIIHIFNRTFTEIVFQELDTIVDFVNYLKAKEKFLDNGKNIFLSGEESLLAYYIMNEKSFMRIEESDFIHFDGDSWEVLTKKPEYIKKKTADGPSYLWDEMINRAHESNKPEYEVIARELARISRFERRSLSNAFLDAAQIASGRKEDMYRRTVVSDAGIYCYLFMNDTSKDREKRKAMLAAMSMVARVKYNDKGVKKIIGIATEKHMGSIRSYDYCLYELDKVSDKDVENAKELQDIAGILKEPQIMKVSDEEYPE